MGEKLHHPPFQASLCELYSLSVWISIKSISFLMPLLNTSLRMRHNTHAFYKTLDLFVFMLLESLYLGRVFVLTPHTDG